jgi:hypothetical protein
MWEIEDVLFRVKEQRNILHEICKRKANWIGHICVETAFHNELLKEGYKGGYKWQEDKEEDVESFEWP